LGTDPPNAEPRPHTLKAPAQGFALSEQAHTGSPR